MIIHVDLFDLIGIALPVVIIIICFIYLFIQGVKDRTANKK